MNGAARLERRPENLEGLATNGFVIREAQNLGESGEL